MGLTVRDELGAMLFETVHLAELRLWFGDLWARADAIDPDSIERWAASLPVNEPGVYDDPIGRVGSSFGGEPRPLVRRVARDSRATDVAELLARYPTREHCDSYFGLIAWIYEKLAIDESDSRVVVSAPGNKSVYVTINNRWVLQHTRRKSRPGAPFGIGIFLGSAFERSIDRGELHTDSWQFQPRSSDEVDPPSLVRFADFSFLSNRRVMAEWRRALGVQLRAGARSSNRAHHRPDLLTLALDPVARALAFDAISWPS